MNRFSSSPPQGSLLLVVFFLSGFAALVYQVLWVRQLGLLLGSTAQAAALTLAIFFGGLATGGWFWGRKGSRMRSPLTGFGWLEMGVALTALSHFGLLGAYHRIYPTLYGILGHSSVLDTLLKALLAATLLFPASFLMGGTLPMMVQHWTQGDLGRVGSLLYGVNTAGSALGAWAAGFVLPLALGFQTTYGLGVGLDFAVGLTAVLLAQRNPVWVSMSLSPKAPDTGIPGAKSSKSSTSSVFVTALALGSGFATLGIEVVWTRLFAQVLQNSAYTYALVLTTFLLALALGSLHAHLLSRWHRLAPEGILGILLVLAGVAAAGSPWVFYHVTDGLAYLGANLGWGAYVVRVAMVAGVVMLLPGVLLGSVLPYLLRVLEALPGQAGEQVGRLIAFDTTGAILGSLLTGFVLLPSLGSWRSLLLLAGVYPLVLLGMSLHYRRKAGILVAVVLGLGILAWGRWQLPTWQTVTFGAGPRDHRVEVQEGSHATVAVVDLARGGRAIRVNTYYTLGSSRNLHLERNQAVIPLMIQPNISRVFFLGMGTGISAGAALAFPVENVVVCELLPEVVDLARRHFTPWTLGLFEDPRVTIYAEDGRNCLSRSRDTYDLIISDLFTPWERGTGYLYTLEHYRMAAQRLEPHGVYVQWIPLYQVSERELGIIARTLSEVFPQVVMWRGDLAPSHSIVALMGSRSPQPLDPEVMAERGFDLARQFRFVSDSPPTAATFQALMLRLYAGNVSESGIFDDYPLNTDNHPRVEYLAPQTHRQVAIGAAQFVVGSVRERIYRQLRERVDRDPYLERLTDEQRQYVEAGHAYSSHLALAAQDRGMEAEPLLQQFQDLSPPDTLTETSPARQLLRQKL
ncbi:MAG: fused MFS/spermidine synthase [Cyanobacteriota bacterium]